MDRRERFRNLPIAVMPVALARDYDPGDDPGDDPLADARRGKVRVASSPRPPSTGPRKGKYKT